MSEYGFCQVELTPEHLEHMMAKAVATSLPLDGVVAMDILQDAIDDKRINPKTLMSAQDHLVHIADEIEANGLTEEQIFDLSAKLRILAIYATTALVPVEPYSPE